MNPHKDRTKLYLAICCILIAGLFFAIRAVTASDPTKPSAPVQAGATPVLRGSGEPLPGKSLSLPPLPAKK